MTIVMLLIAAGGLVAGGFLVAFAWAVHTGQFDDTCTPAIRVLLDEPGSPSDRHSEDAAHGDDRS
ncbi:MAG TPA: cbb3-type cytochrome oxidase assembly protein CcoS [Vicinamibacterales bacterium]|nr:cbb3-type cytochrome oxidase assembly protein CcoS [Vicinamibacterales bacterium]